MPTNIKPNNRQELPTKSNSEARVLGPQISYVATPIGNLSDLSTRAIQTLGEADEIWAEDTRHTLSLLNSLKIIGKKLIRMDQHSTESDIRFALKRVQEMSLKIALVTDAGTPGLSDPGAQVVRFSQDFPLIRFVPIPGSSALLALLSVAGIQQTEFAFLGFFPRSSSDAMSLLHQLETSSWCRAFVFFESPHRIRATLETLSAWMETVSDPVRMVLAKELTKIHESLWSGSGQKFLQAILHQSFDERGEWCFALDLSNVCVKMKKTQPDWMLTLECLMDAGVSVKDASQAVQGRFSVAKNLAYKSALQIAEKSKINQKK
jgi:16S rRNA (cytidine1402-2'-O)-methyltransferase